MVDVDPVDLARRRGTQPDRERPQTDHRRETPPLLWAQLLGVVHARNRPLVRRHDHGARDNGAREGAPSHFIHSRQQRSELGPKGPLDPAPPLRMRLTPRLCPVCWSPCVALEGTL